MDQRKDLWKLVVGVSWGESLPMKGSHEVGFPCGVFLY